MSLWRPASPDGATVLQRTADALSRRERVLWAAVGCVAVVDICQTYYGVTVLGLREANPLAHAVLEHTGYAGLVGVKLLVLGAGLRARGLLPRRYRFVAPACLLGPWTVTVAVNFAVIGAVS